MNKPLLISLLLFGIFLAGCGNNQETELLKQQNTLLQSQLQQNTEQVQQDKNFEKNLKCQERGDVLKKQYSNLYSAYYNEVAGTCYVKYYDNNQILTETPIEDFGPALGISVAQLQQSIKLYGGVTYQEVINVLNSFQQPALANLIIKMLLAGEVKDMQTIIGMTGGDVDGYFGQVTLGYLKNTATRPLR